MADKEEDNSLANGPEAVGNTQKPLRGIGGWLLFFLMTLLVYIPFRRLVELNGTYPSIPLIEWVSFTSMTLLQIIAVYFLFDFWRPVSVRFMTIVLWLTNPLYHGLFLVLVAIPSVHMLSGISRKGVLLNGLISVLYAGTWTLYLRFSKRVRNTYFVSAQHHHATQNETAEPSDSKETRITKPENKRIKGKIKLLILFLMIFHPTMYFIRLHYAFADLKQADVALKPFFFEGYLSANIIISLVSAALSCYVGYRLWKVHTPQTVHYAKWFLWLALPSITMAHLIPNMWVLFNIANQTGAIAPLNEALHLGTVPMLYAFLFGGLWVHYLNSATQVRTVYLGQDNSCTAE